MFRLTIWTREYKPVGTIERPSAVDLLDMGARLQKDYGAIYKIEYVAEVVDFCPDCGKECRQCC